MHIIDTHCHIGLHKYEPVETLLFHMQRAGVEQAVFIQYMGNTDNARAFRKIRSRDARPPGR
jgi:Tat protein secretion system quality control protein TatD with DNase activity